jgi:hypothetical protein
MRNRRGRLTDRALRQPGQGVDTVSSGLILDYPDLAIIIDITRHPVQLQRGLDQPRQPEHKEDKAANDKNARKQWTSCNEDLDDEEECDAESAHDHHVWEEPADVPD